MLPFACLLPHRGLLRICGADRVGFLNGLVSNDVTKATGHTGTYAALLTPQGKFLHDLFVLFYKDSLLIDCEAVRTDDLIQRLSAYRLRSQVVIENVSDLFDVWAVWDAPFSAEAGFFPDPRLPQLGGRMFVEKAAIPKDVTQVDFTTYDSHRLALGVADGSHDMEIGKSTLAEGNFDLLNGIDWKKGCYVGQELTARMRYRGLVKKRLFPVRGEGGMPAWGTVLTLDGVEVGEMRSSGEGLGLALVKIETAQQVMDEKRQLSYQDKSVFVLKPDWMKIDEPSVNR